MNWELFDEKHLCSYYEERNDPVNGAKPINYNLKKEVSITLCHAQQYESRAFQKAPLLASMKNTDN